MASLYKSNGPAAMAAALASMILVAVLLVLLTFVSRDRHKQGASS
jgi:putative spermidine/putrescine transport system permease protein